MPQTDTMSLNLSGKTLLQVIPKLVGGGAEQTTLEVNRAFLNAGGRSMAVSSGGGMAETLIANGGEHIALPVDSKNPWLIAQNARDIGEIICNENVSVVHARSRAPAWSVLQAAHQTGCPFVTTYHGFYSAKTGLKRLYNSAMVRSDAIIANSAFTAEHIHKEYGGRAYFDPTKVTTIPRGADLSRFAPEAVSPEGLARAQSVFGEGLRVLLPGRFTSWKGQRVLINALTSLKRDHPKTAFSTVMIGRMDEKPDYVDELRAQITDAGLAAEIQLLPATDDLPSWLAASDVVVSASTAPEAFGRVAVEAQAAGKPIIATAHGGALETVLDGKTGRLIAPGNVEALASALAVFHDNSADEREAMGARGINHVRLRYSTEAMTEATLLVYESLIAGWETRGEKQR